MEINITRFFKTEAPMDYSASIAEIGKDAGPDTWRAANENASEYADLLDTEEKRDTFKAHMRDMGFSEADEFATWTNEQLTALFMQLISGDMREVPDVDMGPDMTDEDWQHYERLAEHGTVSGSIYRGDDGEVYYYLGS